MKQYFIKKENNSDLLLVFGGWGSEPALFSETDIPAGYDVLMCYDYRDRTFDTGLLAGYGNIRLIAWSMGVWAASSVFSDGLHEEYSWQDRIAVNGTMHPIDDKKGIPVAIFDGTLSGMSVSVLGKFTRRMCGKDLATYRKLMPVKPVEDLAAELSALKDWVLSGASAVPETFWTCAVIGSNDMIFPAANQLEAWKDIPVRQLQAAHYDAQMFQELWTNL